MRPIRFALLGLMIALIAGCSSSGAAGRRSAARDTRTLSAQEIRESASANLYEVIRARRPEWLIKRGQTSINLEGDIVVYVDNVALGGPETLRGIDVQSVQVVRFLSASEAQMRYGVGHMHGAIVVTTRTG
jgi:hypothetical protein